MPEPVMPILGADNIPDPVKTEQEENQNNDNSQDQYNQSGQENDESNANNDNSGQPGSDNEGGSDDKGGQKDGGTPNEPAKEVQDLIDGWKEDRTKLEQTTSELREAKAKLAKYEKNEDDEELAGLSEDERIDKIIARREKQKTEAKTAQEAEVAEEVRFYERTNKEFRDNKKAILVVASKFNATNIDQAIKIWKAQQTVVNHAKNAGALNEKNKRNANGTQGGGSNGGGQRKVAPYDPKVDSGKSFQEMYADGGIS